MTRPAAPPRADAPHRDIVASGGVVTLTFSGSWRMDQTLPDIEAVRQALAASPAPQKLVLAGEGVTGWDSLFLTQCRAIIALARERGVAVDAGALPPGVESLLALAAKVPERQGAARAAKRTPFLERMADMGYGAAQGVRNLLDFTGDVTLAAWALVTGRAVFQRSQLTTLIYQASIDALGIVSLISFLVGLILAFVGAIQLSQFGAQIYVSTIVGIAMVRVMGAIMTGIIMAGRTGAAYAAELGTMQVNEEIDALRTFGFSPTQFLVLPRMIALVLMMPLLCIYADLMGIMGGFVVGVFMLKINPIQYLTHTWQSVPLANFWIGLVHSTVFGVLVAMAGCYRGMRCGRSALGVGQATTAAVVTSILAIVIATAILTVCCNIIGV
ncbi:MlaE family ABC transporter permease [Solidesulfovibrio magneticus]|uniref:ABC transporter permease protein n=1 Tax=Solidesulfovibrio magneticus (strain ATCC 700980 / DSM 13731 / RS-1) TaxID=573370 RepID=C4XJN8_SOLM1|nr:ABC transporter permease [Solidesulfovibrio magneticus]BAH76785.1 putative ABC transporter permease protein [Solidesulfovibrio magneticus RS-1]